MRKARISNTMVTGSISLPFSDGWTGAGPNGMLDGAGWCWGLGGLFIELYEFHQSILLTVFGPSKRHASNENAPIFYIILKLNGDAHFS